MLYQLNEFQELNNNAVLFVENSDGSEEIPSRNIKAIVLSHDLPQLSHLAIRARQSGVIFVCCDTRAPFNKLLQKANKGEWCQLQVFPEKGAVEVNTINHEVESALDVIAEELKESSVLSLSPRLDESIVRSEEVSVVFHNFNSGDSASKQSVGTKCYNSLGLYRLSQKSGMF